MRLVNHEITRRTMLSRSAQAAAFAAVVSGLEPLFAAPRQRWFKIGVCDWTLRRCDPSCFELAKQIGVEGVQVSMVNARSNLDLRKPQTQKAYLAAADKAGLEIASLGVTGIGSLMLNGDSRAARQLDQSIDVCKALELTVSMPAFFSKLDEKKPKEIEHVIGILRQVAPRAEKEGIVFGMENSFSAEDNMRIIDGVGSSAVTVYYDTGNSNYRGTRDIYKEIRMLGDRIGEFHAKDIELHGKKFIGRMLGQGKIDFNEVRKAIDDIRYSGWIQIEIEGVRPQKLIPGCRADYKYLRSIFPERQ